MSNSACTDTTANTLINIIEVNKRKSFSQCLHTFPVDLLKNLTHNKDNSTYHEAALSSQFFCSTRRKSSSLTTIPHQFKRCTSHAHLERHIGCCLPRCAAGACAQVLLARWSCPEDVPFQQACYPRPVIRRPDPGTAVGPQLRLMSMHRMGKSTCERTKKPTSRSI